MSTSPDAAGPSRPSLRLRAGTSAHVCLAPVSTLVKDGDRSTAGLKLAADFSPLLPCVCDEPLQATEPPPVIKLETLDSSFQLSEYLDVLVQRGDRVRDLVRLPLEGGGSDEGGDAWEVDENLWLYVHLLRLPRDLTPLIAALLDSCSIESCPSMVASHWHYMCAVHPGPPRQCSSIDYILHTLDHMSQILTSSKLFPSRVSISPSSRRHLEAVTRRVARFFGHAYHHHPEVFEACEGETELCSRLVNLVSDFGLVSMEDIPFPTDLFLLRSDGGSSSSGSDDGDNLSADGEEASWGVGFHADDDDEDFAPRRASDGRAPKGFLLDFGDNKPRDRSGAGSDDDDEDDDQEGSDDEDDGDNEERDEDEGDQGEDALRLLSKEALADSFLLDDESAPASAPSFHGADVESDVPTLEAADPSPTSSSGSSPRLEPGSPPTPSDSPEPPFDEVDVNAVRLPVIKQVAVKPVAATTKAAAQAV